MKRATFTLRLIAIAQQVVEILVYTVRAAVSGMLQLPKMALYALFLGMLLLPPSVLYDFFSMLSDWRLAVSTREGGLLVIDVVQRAFICLWVVGFAVYFLTHLDVLGMSLWRAKQQREGENNE